MIPLLKIHTPDGLEQMISSVWKSGFVGEGEYSSLFEDKFAKYIGNTNTSLVNSCSSAITLASKLCDIQPGDEVITTPLTCMAMNEPFFNDGANLVWADIDPSTGNINPESVKRNITSKTKAIVGVHWAGQPFDIDAINNIANEAGVKVIEDAAHALGATYRGKLIGSHSDYVCFSFQAVKHITTGDGGAICSQLKRDDERIKALRWYGFSRSYDGNKWDQDITETGFKFHMNNMNAAIGLLQMNHVEKIIATHQNNSHYFNDNICNSKVTKLRVDDASMSACWLYTIMVEDRIGFQKYMLAKGIACDPLHIRNDIYNVFRKFRKGPTELPGVDYFCSRHINIPVGWWLTEKQRDYIVETVNRY
jgi:dTDP-4-amino-4,6-dideoxygalactose transaminase